MFLINGEPMHEKTHTEEFKWMQEKYKELRSKNKKTWNYSAFNKRAKFLCDDGSTITHKDRRRIVSMVGSTDEATSAYQNWAYFTGMAALISDGANGYKLKRSTMALDFDTVFDIDRDIELIFFFEYLSKNHKVKRVDREAIARENAEKTALRAKAESLVYSNDSPIHPSTVGSEDPLKNIAFAWGVTNALTLDVYSVMNELWRNVQASNSNYRSTKKGYAEFIDEVKKYGSTTKRSIITQAIQKGILSYDSNLWKMYTEGGIEQFLCAVPVNEEARRDEHVMNYILNHEPIYEAVKSIVKNPVKIKIPEERVKSKNGPRRFELLKIAKAELGWGGKHYNTIARMNGVELLDLVEQKRRPEPEPEPLEDN